MKLQMETKTFLQHEREDSLNLYLWIMHSVRDVRLFKGSEGG